MKWTLVIAVMALTATSIALGQERSASRDQRSSVEQAIRQLDNERIQAQLGSRALDFTSGDLKFQSITTDDVQVRVYGNTAVETGRSTMDGQDKGQTVPRDTRFTRVWVKQEGRWQLVANHYSSQITDQ